MAIATTRRLDSAQAVGEARAALFHQALAHHEKGEPAEAAVIYRQLLAQQPEVAGLWCNLGIVLRQMRQFSASAAAAGRAVELDPRDPSSLSNYGNVLLVLNRLDEAIAMQAKAAEIAPSSYQVHQNYGLALREAGRHEEAIVRFEKALALKPGDVEAQWERGTAHLCLGRLREGWADLEMRWQRGRLKEMQSVVPRWQGEDLTGKTILIHEEQGFGDTILCSRYIPLVKARGARVLFGCRKALHRLFQGMPGLDRVVEPGKLGESFHYRSPLMSLPGIFETDLGTIPPPARLHVPAIMPAEAGRLLAEANGRFKIGIVWSGNPNFAANDQRAVHAERFLRFAEIPGVQLYSLQKGPREAELAECGGQGLVVELGPHLDDFADTTAVVSRLDLVIMTDSAVAHLAGSLGRPVWNLLGCSPFWLYMHQGEDTPWYPAMRLFRQPRRGDWDSLFCQVAVELRKVVEARSSVTGSTRGVVV